MQGNEETMLSSANVAMLPPGFAGTLRAARAACRERSASVTSRPLAGDRDEGGPATTVSGRNGEL